LARILSFTLGTGRTETTVSCYPVGQSAVPTDLLRASIPHSKPCSDEELRPRVATSIFAAATAHGLRTRGKYLRKPLSSS
jgi:hypothetical protein